MYLLMNLLKIKIQHIRTKLNRLEKRILDATTIININQYDPVKENLDGCIGDVDKAKYQIRVVYSLQLFWIKKLVKLRIRFLVLVV